MRRKRHFLTETEREKIRTEYPDTPTKVLASEMGLPYHTICHHAYKMKLRKSEDFLKSEESGRLRGEEGFMHRFPKGIVPHNKGKKMDAETYKKCSKSMFKKGNEPHNTLYDGYERISRDGYRERRVSKGKFRAVHHIVWEQHNGPIPSGHIVCFKDKNPLNCEIENLECITKKENCARNSIVRYPNELRKLIHLNSKLKKESKKWQKTK